ncbi:MAG: phosphotransferase [Actinophytocola sp.]|uniref:phosphotransferase n=1 Tax=Actinophytocola sp. TaxID=1872138 RepID=UPI003C77E78D
MPTGHNAAAPVPTAGKADERPGAVKAAAPVLDGELISEAEYQRSRARRLAESAVSRLPAQWQTPGSEAETGTRRRRRFESWEDALNQPWERSGRFLASQMPDGTTEPDETAADLDQWCLQHLEENDGARDNARYDGIEAPMVTANLPEHTPITEMNSLTRTAAYLIQRGSQATEAERDAYETRRKALMAKLSQAETECMDRVPSTRLDTATRKAWADLCAAHAPALADVDDHARLVHSDLNPKNILVTRTGRGWRVDAVLDWEFSYSGCPYADAANMTRFGADYPNDFLDGFRAAFADNLPGDLTAEDWLYLGRVLDMFALSSLATEEHPIADQAAREILRWVADGLPDSR